MLHMLTRWARLDGHDGLRGRKKDDMDRNERNAKRRKLKERIESFDRGIHKPGKRTWTLKLQGSKWQAALLIAGRGPGHHCLRFGSASCEW